MSTTRDLAALFRRDLSSLIRQIDAFPNDEAPMADASWDNEFGRQSRASYRMFMAAWPD